MTELLDRPVSDDGAGGGVDAFRVLGLPYSPDLSDGDVHRAFRARLRAVHPDAGGDAGAAAAVWLAARVVVAAGVVVVAQVVVPGDPAVPALGVGADTWLVLRGRLDLAPGRRC